VLATVYATVAVVLMAAGRIPLSAQAGIVTPAVTPLFHIRTASVAIPQEMVSWPAANLFTEMICLTCGWRSIQIRLQVFHFRSQPSHIILCIRGPPVPYHFSAPALWGFLFAIKIRIW